MRHWINRLVCILFAVMVVVFAAFMIWDRLRNTNTPPQILCESDTLSVSIQDGQEALLAGVTATDAEDGDLTDRVLVESVSRFVEKGVCRVTYAVQDSHNAVTKMTRSLQYTDYTSPRFSLSAPMLFEYGKSFDPTNYITATDCIDGDISGNIRMTLLEEEPSISGVGTWQVRFRVTNSMGETVYLTTNVTVVNWSATEKNYTPMIRLKQYLVYVPVGGSFNPSSYVSSVSIPADDAVDNPIQLQSRLRYTSDVDTAVPGTYTVTYSCTSSNGYSGSVDLIVVVGDVST